MKEVNFLFGFILILALAPMACAIENIHSFNSGGSINFSITPGASVEATFVSPYVIPYTPIPTIASSDNSNDTAADLKCSFTPIDKLYTTLSAYILWTKDGSIAYSEYAPLLPNATPQTITLSDIFTSVGEKWTCNVTVSNYGRNSTSAISGNLTVVAVASSGGGGGGGGGGGSASAVSFSVTPDLIEIELDYGSVEENTFIIINSESSQQTFTLSTENLGNLISYTTGILAVEGDKSKIVSFKTDVSSLKSENVYIGKLKIKGDTKEKTINIIISVTSPIKEKKSSSLKISNPTYSPGQILTANLEVLNLSVNQTGNGTLEYWIVDFNNNTIFFRNKTFEYGKGSEEIEFTIPDNFPEGNYVLYSKLRTSSETLANYRLFEVKKDNYCLWILIALILILVLLLIIFKHENKREKLTQKKSKIHKVKTKISPPSAGPGFFYSLWRIIYMPFVWFYKGITFIFFSISLLFLRIFSPQRYNGRKKIVNKFSFKTTATKVPKDLNEK